MKQVKTEYKMMAFVTFEMRPNQGQVSQDQIDDLVENFIESADCAGLFDGHFHMHYDGDNILNLFVPCADKPGYQLSVGMALGSFVERVSRENLLDFWLVSSGLDDYKPDLRYVSMREC